MNADADEADDEFDVEIFDNPIIASLKLKTYERSIHKQIGREPC